MIQDPVVNDPLISVLCAVDSYKISHHRMYPAGTTSVVSNLTPRGSRIQGINEVVWYGLQGYVLEWIMGWWGNFFRNSANAEVDIDRYEDECRTLLGDPSFSAQNFRQLQKLGYLPIEIRALKEGTRVPLRIPCMTIRNTHPDFAWLTNFLETQISAQVWKLSTCATIAAEYRRVFEHFAEATGASKEFVLFQGHDFSLRGMSGVADGAACGSAHLLSFQGSDTIPAILYAREFYGAQGFVAGSVPATEHSIAQTGGADEFATVNRLMDEFPKGIMSYVADTTDFFKFVTETLPRLKDRIMARDGKFVVRPDSGDPVLILTGDPSAQEPEVRKGLIQCLWDTFGGTVNEKGFKVLDPHIGAIYGDSITLERQFSILARLEDNGFASSNIVLGIGSFTYNYLTRDTFGWAIKATAATIDGQDVQLFKKPKTDNGLKNSAKGLCLVTEKDGKLCLTEGVSWDEFLSPNNLLEPVFTDGKSNRMQTFNEIRNILWR